MCGLLSCSMRNVSVIFMSGRVASGRVGKFVCAPLLLNLLWSAGALPVSLIWFEFCLKGLVPCPFWKGLGFHLKFQFLNKSLFPKGSFCLNGFCGWGC